MINFNEFFSIDNKNGENLRNLYDSMQNNGVIPFIGAGLSMPIIPTWSDMLRNALVEYGYDKHINKLNEILSEKNKEKRYETAANYVYGLLEEGNYLRYLERMFNKPKDIDLSELEIVNMLPDLSECFKTKLMLTTNFDNILNIKMPNYINVFPNNKEAVRNGLWNNEKQYIFKLHGDVEFAKTITLRSQDYDKIYHDQDVLDELHKLFTKRPLLFMGCSLEDDRFMELLYNWRDDICDHYAIVEKPTDEDEFLAKQRHLSKHKICPIWYPIGQHEYIKLILNKLMEAVNGQDEYILYPITSKSLSETKISEPAQFWGRFDELTQVNNILGQKHINSIIIKGMGGVGKTTLCRKLYYDPRLDFSKVVWLTYTKSLKETIISTQWSFINDQSGTRNYDQIIEYLQNCCRKNKVLFFIDNITLDDKGKEMIDTINKWGGRIIANTRDFITEEPMASFEYFNLELLEEEQAIQLFANYFKQDIQSPEDIRTGINDKKYSVIKPLVALAGYHTLAIELLAKTASKMLLNKYYRNSFSVNDIKYVLEDFLVKITDIGFKIENMHNICDEKIKTDWTAYEESIQEQLGKMYDVANLTPCEIKVMKNFSLMAEEEINNADDNWREWLAEFSPLERDELSKKGWIKENYYPAENTKSYSTHRIIKEIVKEKCGIINIIECNNLINLLAKVLKTTSGIYRITKYMPHAKVICDYFGDNLDYGYAELVNNLYARYDDIGMFTEAYKGSTIAIQMREKLLIDFQYDLANSFNSLGYLCAHEKPDYPHLMEGVSLLEKGLKIVSQLPNEKKNFILHSKIINNLGAVQLGFVNKKISINPDDNTVAEYLAKAFEYQEKALKVRKGFDETKIP